MRSNECAFLSELARVGNVTSGILPQMPRVLIGLLLLGSCSAPGPIALSPSPSSSASVPAETSPPTTAPSPSSRFTDLKITPAGDVRGDHVLVLQVSSPSGGFPVRESIWDVPLDG